MRAEVEKRGMRWADAEVEDRNADTNMTDSNGQLVNGSSTTASDANTSTDPATSRVSGRLTDEELVARLQERLHESEEDEGVHL